MEDAQMITRTARLRDPVVWGAVLVVLVTQVVYLLTLTISCPFWDSGEFIATSYTLGIPHPPGTPLYVLIGRLFSMIPIGQISARVNYLSALASTMAVLFTYLVIVKLVRRWTRRPENMVDVAIAVGGGIAGAFFTAFGRTFWDDAIEAEVYALSSFVMILCVWLALKWEESGWRDSGKHNNNLLLLMGYLLFVTIGIHMGTFLVAPPIFLFVLLVSRRTVFNRETITTLVLAAASIAIFYLAMGLGASVGFSLALSALAFTLAVVHRWRVLGEHNLTFWLIALALLGLTVQLFLIVRANLDPMINEADPNNWKDLWLVLSRDQYKPPNPFVLRQAPFDIQFTKHFWRYWHDQYHLGIRPEWLAMALPFFLGLVGGVAQALKDRRRFLFSLSLVLITTVFLVFYLNFKENEVRDRDYFFVAGYHFFAIWIGLGVAAIAQWLRGEPRLDEGVVVEPSGGRLFGLGTSVLLCAVSFLPVLHGWHQHDRTDFLVARDYAYNMLAPLEENAVIFTNGDNDTFPLWYIQEVEEVRQDVRVVNLSLLNTHWYIRQLRDYEPKLDVGFSDDEISRLRGFYTQEGDIVLVKDIMVRRLLAENQERPIYLAVTVPDQMDLEKHLVMEGLVFRVVAGEGEAERVDVDTTWKNLREVFLYRGLLTEDGYYDDTVYKDKNARKLVQNYAAAYVRIAHHYLRSGMDDKAIEALEYARRINPAFPGVLYTQGYLWLEKKEFGEAAAAFRELIGVGDHTPEVYRFLGLALERQDSLSAAEQVYREGIRVNPEDFDCHRALFTHFWTVGKEAEAVDLIQNWLARHPDDEMTRQALQELLEPAAPAESTQ
ncbi:MAG: DUF2723 domain-containing protein [Candidatus Eisenbacteria sp.]|nr:DUF2723 domain-containing protein [Candidatus Eisenbacteria bacterium]